MTVSNLQRKKHRLCLLREVERRVEVNNGVQPNSLNIVLVHKRTFKKTYRLRAKTLTPEQILESKKITFDEKVLSSPNPELQTVLELAKNGLMDDLAYFKNDTVVWDHRDNVRREEIWLALKKTGLSINKAAKILGRGESFRRWASFKGAPKDYTAITKDELKKLYEYAKQAP